MRNLLTLLVVVLSTLAAASDLPREVQYEDR